MRTVSIRQFQRNFYNELKDVPFVVVRTLWRIVEGSMNKKKNRPMREEYTERAFVVMPYTEEAEQLAEKLRPTPVSEPNKPAMVTEEVKKGIGAKLRDLFIKQ